MGFEIEANYFMNRQWFYQKINAEHLIIYCAGNYYVFEYQIVN